MSRIVVDLAEGQNEALAVLAKGTAFNAVTLSLHQKQSDQKRRNQGQDKTAD